MRIVILIVCFCFIFYSCDTILSSGEQQTVYYNSFETAKDISGWLGLNPNMFVDDPAPNSGNKSLHIGGGCLQPAASYKFPLAIKPGIYKITCWAKLGNHGGGISLRSDDDQNNWESSVGPKDSIWTYYESNVPFSYSGKSSLNIEILVGGIIPADIYVDNLIIIRIE